MTLPLNLVIDRTAEGKLRAEVAGHPESAVEAADVAGLMNAVQDAFLRFLTAEPVEFERTARDADTIRSAAPVPDPEDASTDEEDQALRRVARERMPDRETIQKMVARTPVPDHWPAGDEDWDDAP